jgi:hypothetical protein
MLIMERQATSGVVRPPAWYKKEIVKKRPPVSSDAKYLCCSVHVISFLHSSNSYNALVFILAAGGDRAFLAISNMSVLITKIPRKKRSASFVSLKLLEHGQESLVMPADTNKPCTYSKNI